MNSKHFLLSIVAMLTGTLLLSSPSCSGYEPSAQYVSVGGPFSGSHISGAERNDDDTTRKNITGAIALIIGFIGFSAYVLQFISELPERGRRRSQVLPRAPHRSSVEASGPWGDAPEVRRCTEEARRILGRAASEGARSGSPAIYGEHLLLALIDLGRGPAARILQQSRLPLADVTGQLRIERDTGTRLTSIDMPFSAEVHRALASAHAEADQSQRVRVEVADLLVGLVSDQTSFASQVLATLGLEISDVRAGLVADQAAEHNLRKCKSCGETNFRFASRCFRCGGVLVGGSHTR